MSTVPPEEEFPLIISVDDHILEPRDPWEREVTNTSRAGCTLGCQLRSRDLVLTYAAKDYLNADSR